MAFAADRGMKHRKTILCVLAGALTLSSVGLSLHGPPGEDPGPEGYLDRAITAYHAGRLDHAERLLGLHVLSNERTAVQGRLLLAKIRATQERLSEAVDAYLEVIKADPGHVEALLGLAQIHERSGDYREAARRLAQARKARPDDGAIIRRLMVAETLARQTNETSGRPLSAGSSPKGPDPRAGAPLSSTASHNSSLPAAHRRLVEGQDGRATSRFRTAEDSIQRRLQNDRLRR